MYFVFSQYPALRGQSGREKIRTGRSALCEYLPRCWGADRAASSVAGSPYARRSRTCEAWSGVLGEAVNIDLEAIVSRH